MKVAFNWSTEDEIVEMVKEMAAADDRKPSPFLNLLVKKAYSKFKQEQGGIPY